MPFELGKLYRLVLIADPEEILFEKKVLHDGETVVFQVRAKEYTVTESMEGKIDNSDPTWQVYPSHFKGSLLYFPSFELMGDKTDEIRVDCSSCMCREPHYIACTITPLTDEEYFQMLPRDEEGVEEEEKKLTNN